MTVFLILITLALAAVVTVITLVQMFYLESQRLRIRDSASMQFFKAKLSPLLKLEIEAGSLTWSVVKHSALLWMGMCVFAVLMDGPELTFAVVIQAALTGWLLMMATAYAIPQMLYRRSRCTWLLPLVPVLRLTAIAFRPVVGVLNFIQSVLEIAQATAEQEDANTPAENIDVLINAGAEEGLVEEEDRKLIQSVVEFGDKIVREVMTPRPNIVAISANASLEQLRQLVINEQYSRIPVYEGSLDQIIGFVHVRDMFELEEEQRAERKTRDIMRPLRFVPETKPASELMREMQQEGTHMVVVVDEYGNTAGLATMEDLVEVILGEIRDEHEPESDVQEDAGGYIVSGSFDVSRLEDMLGFQPAEEIESTTVGGLVTEWLGHVPQPGQVIERDGIRVEVLASDEMRVEQVRVSRPAPAVGQKVEA
jgi:CBS domain containing-hemolysin-like protein